MVHGGFGLPSKSAPYKGSIRIVLAAILEAEIDFLSDSQGRSIQLYRGNDASMETFDQLRKPKVGGPKLKNATSFMVWKATVQELELDQVIDINARKILQPYMYY